MYMSFEFSAPLPANEFKTHLARDAYDKCLRLEQVAPISQNESGSASPTLCARLLGYLLREAPDFTSLDNLSIRIMDCPDDSGLLGLTAVFTKIFLACFVASQDVPDASVTWYDCHDLITSARQLSGPPTTYKQAKVAALVRDGFRCIFTGRYDRIVAGVIPDVKEHVLKHDSRTNSTRASFILPEGRDDPDSDNEFQVSSSSRVGLSHLMLSIYGIRVDEELECRTENILTMAIDHYVTFNTFGLWLEHTETPHQYKVGYIQEGCAPGVRPIVTLTSTDPKFPLPSPRYLRVHAACARALHFSGFQYHVAMLLSQALE